jgi:vacuolar protein sorting-associated protein IST1
LFWTQVIEKLSAGAPDVQTKTKTLSSIAAEHNIKWEPKAFEENTQKQNEDLTVN